MTALRDRRSRRWWQFHLRTLLVVVALVGGLLVAYRAYLAPYRAQQQAIEVIQKLGGRSKTSAASAWHRAMLGGDLQNITLADLGASDEVAEYLPAVAALPALDVLAVGGEAFGDAELRRLAGLKTLRLLVLDSVAVSDAAVAELQARLPTLEIYRSQRRIMMDFMVALVTRPAPDQPVVLVLVEDKPEALRSGDAGSLSQDYFRVPEEARLLSPEERGDDALLGRIAALRRLKKIWFTKARLTDTGLAHLASLSQLHDLHVDETAITDAGMIHLTGLANLEQLGLTGTQVGDAGLKRLATLPKLMSLQLSRTKVTDAGMKTLAALPTLKYLMLDDVRLTDAGLRALAASTSLEWLWLRSTPVTDVGLSAVRDMRTLKMLSLTATQVTDAGLEHLKALPLESLYLSSAGITDAGLKQLENLTTLQRLGLEGTKVTAAGVERLRKALPQCTIEAALGADIAP